MGQAIEFAPAPTIFVTDMEQIETAGQGLIRITLVEEIGEERRIVAYIVWPIEGYRRARERAAMFMAAPERREFPTLAH